MSNATVGYTPGTGKSIATYDDTAGASHQKAVIEFQTGSSDPVPVNATNPLPVSVLSGGAAAGSSSTPSTDILSITPQLATAPGTSVKRVQALATVNNTLVKSSPGIISTILLTNGSAAIKFLKLFDKATAPAAGTDTPIATFAMAANGGKIELDMGASGGIPFATGIGFAITGAVLDSDTTAVAAGDVTGLLIYK